MNVHCKVAEKPAGVVSLNVFWMVMTQTRCENLGWTIWNHQVNHNLKLTIVNDCLFSIFCCEIGKSLKLGEKINCHVWLPEGMYIYIYVIQCVSKYNSIYIYMYYSIIYLLEHVMIYCLESVYLYKYRKMCIYIHMNVYI